MKRFSRILGIFLCIFVMLSVECTAAHAEIDVANAADGYFSVYYEGSGTLKMKVSVTVGGKTTYYSYVPGAKATYALEQGDGDYTIVLYRNLSGTRYQKVLSKQLSVTLKDALAPYLASTCEITFSKDDAIGKKAAELCADLTDRESKILAIYNFIAASFQYDDVFADAVRRGAVKNYTPDTNGALEAGKGVCYDLSAVFAAMCRSQGIPCALVKGYTEGGYHAWNLIRVNDAWAAVDVTAATVQRTCAKSLSDCLAALPVLL